MANERNERGGKIDRTGKVERTVKIEKAETAEKVDEVVEQTTKAERKAGKKDTEASRRKKEEQARRARRRSRQWIGFALSVLVVVGVVSIVRSAINVTRDLLDNSAERDEYAARVEPLVWFDMLPFTAPDQIDQNAVKQVAIWGYMTQAEAAGTLERTDDGMQQPIVPVLEVDRYAAELFGPGYTFDEHGAFYDVSQGLQYQFDADRNAYLIPGTGLEPPYSPVVMEIKNEANGVKRVTVGYVSLRNTDGAVLGTPDYEHPVRYMDFMFQRDGNEYYLYALYTNDTYAADGDTQSVTTVTNSNSVPAEEEPIVISVAPQSAADSLPEDAGTDAPADDGTGEAGSTGEDGTEDSSAGAGGEGA